MNAPRIAGKYELLRKIASGGMAEVFLAKHMGLDGFEKLVVLKRILPKFAGKSEYVRMFLDEAKTAADLRHPNLVNTYEIGEDDGNYFMIMEYLQGQDVRSVFLTAQASKLSVPLAISVGIAMDACSGLYYAHTKKTLNGGKLGIVHRDISPHNMIVTYEGQTKIVDFGIAQSSHVAQVSKRVLRGKYSYMSPEQILGLATDHRTDIFGLGIVLFEMTTMHRLFRRETESQTLRAVAECIVPDPVTLLPHYPPQLAAIVMRALKKDPAERFESCEAFRVELENFLHQNTFTHSPSRLAAFMRELFPESANQDKTAELFQQLNPIVTTKKSVPIKQYLLAAAYILSLIILIVATGPLSQQISMVLPESEEGLTKFVPAPSTVSLKPGRLKVVVEPWAEVFVNGKRIGSTPLPAQTLDAGEYEIRLENPKLRRKIIKSVTIASGKDTLIRHVW